jgi:hypothetical protein
MRPSWSFTVTGTRTRLAVVLMVKPTSSPVSLSLGTLPAGTVFMGGMGGGGADWPKSDVGGCRELDSGTSFAEWGRSCDPVVTPLPVVSGGVESGWLACSRGLGSGGGGIGRVADGASGMSPGGCCCAGRPPVKSRLSPRISMMLIFLPAAIREPSVFRGSVLRLFVFVESLCTESGDVTLSGRPSPGFSPN